jgi:hypothetical protein
MTGLLHWLNSLSFLTAGLQFFLNPGGFPVVINQVLLFLFFSHFVIAHREMVLILAAFLCFVSFN